MKNHQLFTLFFFSIIITPLFSQEKSQKLYAWQQDDSELIKGISYKNESTFILSPQETFTQNQINGLKKTVRRWTTLTPTKPKFTETERKKKVEIEQFLQEHQANSLQNMYNRDMVLGTLSNWHHSKFILMLDDPQLNSFIENRFNKKDFKTLHALATYFSKSAETISTKNEINQTQTIVKLETKALEILAKINALPYVNQAIKTNIQEHLAWMKQNRPDLYGDYVAITLPQTPVTFGRLGWMPNNKELSNLQPTATKHAPHTIAPTSELSVLATGMATASPTVEIKETIQEEIERLSRSYVKQFKNKQTRESLATAWQVTKKAKQESKEFQAARNHIKKISTQKAYDALCMMALLEKENLDQAIAYFIQAQTQRSGTICENPSIKNPQNVLIFLAGSPLPITFKETAVESEARLFLKDLVVSSNNKRAAQALALFHYKNAAVYPQAQLIYLAGAKQYADLLDPAKDAIDPALDLNKLYCEYYQQLYWFASNENNYTVKKVVPFTNLFLSAKHLALATIELSAHDKKNPLQGQYGIRANAAFNRTMQTIHDAFKRVIEERMDLARQDHSQIHNLSVLLVKGLCEMPLSMEERKKITDFLNSIPHCSDPIAQSLRTHTFENSLYAHVAALSNNKEDAQNYFRMLFEIDCGNYAKALTHAKEASKSSSFYTPLFLKSLLMRSGLIFKTDAQKLVSIKSNITDHMKECITQKAAFLHDDAIAELEQMRLRKYLPAFPLLISYHCTDMPESANVLVKLLEEAASAAASIQDLKQANIISESTVQTLLDYFSMNSHMPNPIYYYLQLLLEGLITSADFKELTEYIFEIQEIQMHLKTDLKVVKQESILCTSSPYKNQLIEKLEAILANKQNVNNLQSQQVHQIILNLYHVFNPQAQLAVDQELEQLLTEHLGLELHNPPIRKKNLLKTHKDRQQSDNLTHSESLGVPLSSYLKSDHCALRDKIQKFRKNNDFRGYKELQETEQCALSDAHEISSDPTIKIDNLVIKMAHEYMLAQSDSEKPLDPLEIPSIQSLIQKAITIHPFYSYQIIGYELLNDDIWPQNKAKAQEYLHKAITNAEKNINKLSLQDIFQINSTREQLKKLAYELR
ncbi:MAG: hypothetical protein AMXMBFR12_03670 [Candidatus Babeliales bacterium]